MNGWTYACLVVGLLFLAAPAGALIPDDITNETSWATAGSGEPSTVIVGVVNCTGPISVNFAVDTAYGSISPSHVSTGNDHGDGVG